MSSLSDTGSVFSAAANVEPSQFLDTRGYIRRFPQQNQALFFCVVLLNEYSYTHFNEIVLNNCC